MRKVVEIVEDNRRITNVIEDYEGEAEEIFADADNIAREKVDVAYTICTLTEENIELWRSDWIDDKGEQDETR